MRVITTLAVTALMAGGSATAAPLIDIYGGAYTGRIDVTGDLGGGNRNVDLESELGYGNARQTVFYVGLEHPVPVIPNVRLRQMSLSDSSRGTLNAPFSFAGQNFAPGPVASKFDLDATDLTLYYTPIDLVVKLDLGLTVRRLDAEFQINDGGPVAREKASATIPMLHAGVYGKLPFTGFYARGEVNGVSFDGDRLVDSRAGIGWVSDFLLGLELGYSSQVFDFDVDDVKADLDMSGPYLAISLNF